MKDDTRALIVVVNTRKAECTLQCLKSAATLEQFSDVDVVVADNNSGSGVISQLQLAISEYPNVELVEARENLGYFGAAKLGLKHYLLSHAMPDWIIVSNDDILFPDVRFLTRLFQKDAESVGMVAPTIISALTEHDANPSVRQRPGRLRMLRYRIWISNYYTMWFKQWLSPHVRKVRFRFSDRTPSPEKSVCRPIYAPHGSFLIFSRRFFEAGGFIDDGAFLYYEEFSVAEMCRQMGLPVIHDPELRVRHEEGQTLGRKLSRASYLHQKNGFGYIWFRYKNSYPELGRRGLERTLGQEATAHKMSSAVQERAR